MWSRWASSGWRIGVNSKPEPVVAGVNLDITAPWGIYTNPSLCKGAAAVLDCAVRAGIMESSSGRASVVPTPFSKVRRDRCVLVTNLMVPASSINAALTFTIGSGLHLERGAHHDPQN